MPIKIVSGLISQAIFRMAKLNRVGKPTVGLIKAMDGVASITSSINKVTGAPVAYARTLSGSSNRVVRGASYLAKGADNISTNLAKKLRPTGEKFL
jgi:phosphoribosylcarboxyaminoimidazole (NCAIR) mutase